MKNFYKRGFSSVVVIIITLVVIAAGFYFYYAPTASNNPAPTGDNSNEPVGFEENPWNMPNLDVQSDSQVNNPNIPVVTEEPIIGAQVNIKNFAFSPTTVTIKAGQSVEWVNNDSSPHTITSDTGLFDSGNESSGQSYSHKFDKPGTYAYHCAYHPNMKGTVIVTQ
jgi:plastocyanin